LNFVSNTAYNISNFSLAEGIVAASLLVILALVTTLRASLFFGYMAVKATAVQSAKTINNKSDIKKLSDCAFGRAAREYATLAERGGNIDATALVEMAVVSGRKGWLFFNFKSLGRCIKALERVYPIFTILAILALERSVELVAIAAIIYFLMLVLAAVFDYETAKERFIGTTAHLLARDVGRFFPADSASAIYTFGNDLNEYLNRQSLMFYDVLNKVNTEFTAAIMSNVSAMTKNIDATLNAISRHDGLDTALAKWQHAIDSAAAMQADTADTVTRIKDALDGLAASDAESKAARGEIQEDIKLLTVAVQRFNLVSTNTEMRNEALAEGLSLVRDSQHALANSVSTYETTVKALTSQMGDALGRMVDHHIANAGSQVADSISDSIKAASRLNIQQAEQVKAIFDEIREQNHMQTRLLHRILNEDHE